MNQSVDLWCAHCRELFDGPRGAECPWCGREGEPVSEIVAERDRLRRAKADPTARTELDGVASLLGGLKAEAQRLERVVSSLGRGGNHR